AVAVAVVATANIVVGVRCVAA
ncbi:hypothetical protein A2U01_0086473, partial [Trifolium medium]|nr:hypothetical protein [Trifolium medium]